MKGLRKQLLKQYQEFLDEVLRKLVRAEIDKAVFEIRRNEKDRSKEERAQANKLYISTAESVKDFYQVVEVINEKIKDLK